jgi:hypothetical protein
MQAEHAVKTERAWDVSDLLEVLMPIGIRFETRTKSVCGLTWPLRCKALQGVASFLLALDAEC